jgi:UDP-N-acetylmuramoylalanine--D-glutamate ligase
MAADYRGKRVTIMGLGSFGGGIGACQFFAAQGADVTVTDLKPADELAASVAALGDVSRIALHLGGHDERDFRNADVVVASPAVPGDNRYLRIARDAGVLVTREMNLFWERNRGHTVCVTGSNGKSTTAALITALLTGDGTSGRRVWLGGNIGKSLLPVADQIQAEDIVVLELSSFQLEDLAPLEPSPQVAVITNFSPNHLDRHGSVEAYRAAKQNILRWQTADHFAVLNQSDPDVSLWPTKARKVWFGRDDEGRQGMFAIGFDAYKRRALFRFGPREQVLPLGKWLALPGVHNFQNALAAACAAMVLGAGLPDIEAGLTRFAGLPHRLQLVGETGGRVFYNDSKATTPESTLLALDAFHVPVVLLAGGYDKGIDLAGLARGIVARRTKAVALLGQTGPRLQELLREADPEGIVPAKVHVTFEAAFQWAATQSASGDVVLLSPGCASYDWFPNYEARGDEFIRLARGWKPA